MTPRDEAKRMAVVACRLAYVSLFLMLVTTVTQLTLEKPSGFTNAMNIITIGILSGSATLIGRTIRRLRD